jgi:hypothetical protein
MSKVKRAGFAVEATEREQKSNMAVRFWLSDRKSSVTVIEEGGKSRLVEGEHLEGVWTVQWETDSAPGSRATLVHLMSTRALSIPQRQKLCEVTPMPIKKESSQNSLDSKMAARGRKQKESLL